MREPPPTAFIVFISQKNALIDRKHEKFNTLHPFRLRLRRIPRRLLRNPSPKRLNLLSLRRIHLLPYLRQRTSERTLSSRRKDQFSPPTSKQYSSQHELPVRVVPRGGRRTVSVSKKKSQQSRRHLTCEREREREMRARRERNGRKRRETSAHRFAPRLGRCGWK